MEQASATISHACAVRRIVNNYIWLAGLFKKKQSKWSNRTDRGPHSTKDLAIGSLRSIWVDQGLNTVQFFGTSCRTERRELLAWHFDTDLPKLRQTGQ
jgi:hypothetical protein